MKPGATWYRLGEGRLDCVPRLIGWPRKKPIKKIIAENTVTADFTASYSMAA